MLVGDCVHPGVIRSEVVEGENIFCIAERDWIDLATDIRGNTEERKFRFVRNCNREWRAGLLAENTKVAILWVEFDAEFAKAFFGSVEKPIVNSESISAVLDKLLLFLRLRGGRRVVRRAGRV